MNEFAPEIRVRQERLEQINGVLKDRNLAHRYTSIEELGDVTKGEIGILSAEKVVRLGTEGLHLVELPAQFAPDKIDPGTGELKPGARGVFWTFFQTEELAARNQLFIPYVTGAPTNFPTPLEIPRGDATVDRINQQLAELNLKPLPPTAERDTFLGITDVVDVNKKFFTVIVFKVRQPNGEIVEKPIIYNAKSDSGIDGAVFAATIKSPSHGTEPRLVLGQAYRPNFGGWLLETSRGFFSPRGGGQREELRYNLTNVPALNRVIQIASDETGLRKTDNMKNIGRVPQDPTFEASEPDYFSLYTGADAFEQQDLEASQKLRLEFLSYGMFFERIPDIKDSFTLTAIARHLLARDILRTSKLCETAQADGERMVLVQTYRFQHGRYMIEVIRGGENSGLPVNYHLGQLAVNTGIARIMPELMYGTTTWENFKRNAQIDLQDVWLLSPSDVLREIAYGKFDSVTTAAIIKSLHARGFLELNFAPVR